MTMPASTRTKRIVALRALGLGDLLTALPALRALKRAFPDHEQVLAAPAALAPLALLSGAVDGVAHTTPLARLPPNLEGADVAVNLHGKGPESHRALLSSRPSRLIAFAHPAVVESDGAPAWRDDEHEVTRWCRMLDESDVPARASELFLPAPDVEVPADLVGCTIIHPGAKSPARRWPARRFAAIAHREAQRGHNVVITGASDERWLGEVVASLAGLDPGAVLSGRLGLLELAALISRARLLVVGDTGIAHLATAFATPSVVLFGPTSPEQWGPPKDRPQHIALWRGQTGDPHGDIVDKGLLAITVDDVATAIDRLPRA